MAGKDWGNHHHGSHQRLLRMPGHLSPNWPKLDAIVVPTARDPGHLTEAARLARILDCTLVTLHSAQSTNAAQAWRVLPEDVDLIAIDMPAPAHLRVPLCQTTRLLSQTVFSR
jgi:hypothetical protein